MMRLWAEAQSVQMAHNWSVDWSFISKDFMWNRPVPPPLVVLGSWESLNAEGHKGLIAWVLAFPDLSRVLVIAHRSEWKSSTGSLTMWDLLFNDLLFIRHISVSFAFFYVRLDVMTSVRVLNLGCMTRVLDVFCEIVVEIGLCALHPALVV